jgi:hypothetical protein
MQGVFGAQGFLRRLSNGIRKRGSEGTMMECERTYASLESRLATYNLQDRLDRLPDLRLEPNETVVLSADAEELRPHLIHLRPESVYDLKRWLGVPDHAVASVLPSNTGGTAADAATHAPCQIFTPHPPIDRTDPEMQTHLYHFLFGDTRGVSKDDLGVLKKYIDRTDMVVSLFAFQDIYIARRSRLVLDRKVQVLFARYITVERTGVLEMQAPYARIDCAGMSTASGIKIGDNLKGGVTSPGQIVGRVESPKN